MCGITGGVWSEARLAIDPATLQRMTDTLQHRGPDDQGCHFGELLQRPPYETCPGVGLGFRRLSIIDLAQGNQPISNEDGSVWVIFNGEIYNFQQLRHRLEGAGHTLKTQGDAEPIVHLYEDEGLDCFQHLNGMFAIAIWDARHGQLILARDRMGQKPLFYCEQPGRLLFGSELKSILQVPGVPRELDPHALDQYLTYQYVPHPNSIFRGVRKLPPGYLAVYRSGKLHVQPYWKPSFTETFSGTYQDGQARLREVLTDSVRLRLQSEVPWGAFLSGGVDSSLIVALMQQQTEQPVRTFSIGFPVAEYDESRYARRVAEHLGTEHHAFEVMPDGVEVLPRLVWHFDEPLGDSSAIPTWYVSQLTRQHVTVSLTGDGGDELFLGYPRYRAVALAGMMDRLGPLRRVAAARFWQRLPSSPRQKSLVRRFKRFSQALARDPVSRYLDWIAIFNESRRAALYRDDFLEQLPDTDPADFLAAAWRRFQHRDPLTTVSLADLVTYLAGDLMTKVDIASMAHSLECRQPFLDYRVVELAASLPARWKMRHWKGKRILRDAFGDLLPKDIWQRKKMGFGVPLDHWFRDQLRDLTADCLLSDSARCQQYLRRDVIENMVVQHQQGQFDHSYRLWSLLVLEMWMRQWLSP